MPDEPVVERLGWPDVPAAVGTLAAAFADYPLVRAIAPDPAGRARGCEAFCRMLVNYSVRLGHTYATADRSAVACWLPPGREWLTPLGVLRAGALRVLWTLGLRSALLLERLGRAFDAVRAEHARGPHWYLNLLGVRPDARGRGLTRVVLRPVFDEADQAGLPCHLETQDGATVAVYRRLGFELVAESAVPAGLRNWAMRRDPR